MLTFSDKSNHYKQTLINYDTHYAFPTQTHAQKPMAKRCWTQIMLILRLFAYRKFTQTVYCKFYAVLRILRASSKFITN